MTKITFFDINGTLAPNQDPVCIETKGAMVEMQRKGCHIVEITGSSKMLYERLNSNLESAFLQYGNNKYKQYTVLGNACEIYLDSLHRNGSGIKFDREKTASSLEVLTNEFQDLTLAERYHDALLELNGYIRAELDKKYGSKIIFQDNAPAKLTAKPSVEMMMDKVGALEYLLKKQKEEKDGAQITGDCFSYLDKFLGDESVKFRKETRDFMSEIGEFIKGFYDKNIANTLECHIYDDGVDSIPNVLTKPAGVRYVLDKLVPSRDYSNMHIAFAGDSETDYEMTNVAKELGINYMFIAPIDSKIANNEYTDVTVVESPGLAVVNKAREWLQMQ